MMSWLHQGPSIGIKFRQFGWHQSCCLVLLALLCFELKSKFNVFFVAALVRFLLVQSH